MICARCKKKVESGITKADNTFNCYPCYTAPAEKMAEVLNKVGENNADTKKEKRSFVR